MICCLKNEATIIINNDQSITFYVFQKCHLVIFVVNEANQLINFESLTKKNEVSVKKGIYTFSTKVQVKIAFFLQSHKHG